MASIPYSILLCQKENVLPMSTIQDHQKFCKKFLKAHQIFEKYKKNSNSKLAFINDNVFFSIKKNNLKKIYLPGLIHYQKKKNYHYFQLKTNGS